MSFTLLFPNDKKWRRMRRAALEAVVDSTFEEREKQVRKHDFLEDSTPENRNYLTIKENYRRVKSQIEEGRIYDFYSSRRKFRRNIYPLSNFNRFKVIGILKDSGVYHVFKDGGYEKTCDRVSYKACPFCNLDIPESEINEHLKAELCNQRVETEGNQTTVVFDKGIKTEYEKLVFDCTDVKTLKKMVYDRTGISMSKQDVYRGDVLLKNSDTLRNETVVLKQKRREQRK